MNRYQPFRLLTGLCLAALLLSACGPSTAKRLTSQSAPQAQMTALPGETPTPVVPTSTAAQLPLTSTPALRPSTAAPLPPTPTPALPTPTPIPPSPTPRPHPTNTPVPPTGPAGPAVRDPYPLPVGKGGLVIRNYIGKEMTFTIAEMEYRIGASLGNGVPGELFIVLNPGKYTYSASVPGGSTGDEITVEPGVIWVLPFKM